jgi:hypothetical protein
MGSRARLWGKYGEAWGWPAETITPEVDDAVGTDLERALDEFVPRWLEETWGFRSVDFSP